MRSGKRTARPSAPFADLRKCLSDLADSATRGATRRTKGLTAEMSIINPAYNKALDVLAQIEREDAERREDTEMPDDMPDEDFYIVGDQ